MTNRRALCPNGYVHHYLPDLEIIACHFFWKTLPPYLFVSYWWGKKDHGFPNRVISLYRHLSKSTNSCVIFTLLSSRLFCIKTLSVNSWKNFQTTRSQVLLVGHHLKSQKWKQIIRRPKTFDQLGKCKCFGRFFGDLCWTEKTKPSQN